MKQKMWYATAAAAVVVVGVLLLAGCLNPLDGPNSGEAEEHGVVVLRFNDLRARTIVPEISLEVDHYEVSFTRTGFQPVILSNVSGEATQTEAVRLVPGTWDITVEAYNDAQMLIGVAVGDVNVAARQTVTVMLSIQSLEGEGTLVLSAELSELELLLPTITGTIISGATGEVRPISMEIDGSSASLQEVSDGTWDGSRASQASLYNTLCKQPNPR